MNLYLEVGQDQWTKFVPGIYCRFDHPCVRYTVNKKERSTLHGHLYNRILNKKEIKGGTYESCRQWNINMREIRGSYNSVPEGSCVQGRDVVSFGYQSPGSSSSRTVLSCRWGHCDLSQRRDTASHPWRLVLPQNTCARFGCKATNSHQNIPKDTVVDLPPHPTPNPLCYVYNQ